MASPDRHALLQQGDARLRAQAQDLLGLPLDATLTDAAILRLANTLQQVRSHVLQEAPADAYLTSPDALAAYAVGLAPRTLAAVMHELPAVPGASVLDLGCGTGAASLGCRLLGAERFVILDHALPALTAAQRLLESAGASSVTALSGSITRPHLALAGRTFDVVVMAFSLLEAAADDAARAAAILKSVGAFVAPAGHLLIVDSAQKGRARLLNALREPLVEGGFHLLAPCPHEGPCPALERERDFCHAARPWHLPDDMARVGERAGLHRTRLTYAFLLASREAPERSERLRIIGDVLHEKGRARVAVCSAGELRELVVLSRHKDATRALDALERGDEVRTVEGEGRSRRVEDAARLERL